MFQAVSADLSALPGVVLSVQSYGDTVNLHPHIHGIASSGVWSAVGSFEAIPALDTQQLMLLFRHHVIQNLLAAGRISQTAVDILNRFHHPGFSAYEGEGVSAGDSAARERLASYLVHAPFLSLAFITIETRALSLTILALPIAPAWTRPLGNGSRHWTRSPLLQTRLVSPHSKRVSCRPIDLP